MTQLIRVEADRLACSVSSIEDAKLALKELKLLKKSFALKKRELATSIKSVQFDYSQQVKSRGSMVQGRGKIGQIVRAFQRVSRDSKRSALAEQLDPLEQERSKYAALALAADELMIKLEIFLNEQKSA